MKWFKKPVDYAYFPSKDNPCLERFNWTIQVEWLSLSKVGLDEVTSANKDLTTWLIEYNNLRPHDTLDQLTPLEYAQEHYFKVSPMWSASTKA
jgi:transposase InsO family protein